MAGFERADQVRDGGFGWKQEGGLFSFDATGREIAWPARGEWVTLRQAADRLPGWCREALAVGRPVVFLHLDAGLENRLCRIADYLDRLCEERPSLGRISFADAKKAMRQARQARWTAKRLASFAAANARRHGQSDGGVSGSPGLPRTAALAPPAGFME